MFVWLQCCTGEAYISSSRCLKSYIIWLDIAGVLYYYYTIMAIFATHCVSGIKCGLYVCTLATCHLLECCQSAQRIYLYLCPPHRSHHPAEQQLSPLNEMVQQWEEQQIKNDQQKEQENQAATLYWQLPEQMQRAMDCASENGASSRLSTLPIAEHGFALHKGAFRDAYVCGMDGTQDICPQNVCVWQTVHSQPCFKLSLRWSFVIASQRDQRCYKRPSQWGVPQCKYRAWAAAPIRWTAQPQSSQHWRRGLPRCEGTRVLGRPTSVRNFWCTGFNPLAPSNRRLPLPQCFQTHEKEKERRTISKWERWSMGPSHQWEEWGRQPKLYMGG